MKFIVTAGPTREFIDPVRFLSNPSTGRMGFAVARAARAAGHDVTLVAGPVALRTPRGVTRVDIVSARDLLAAVTEALKAVPAEESAALVMTAAVADWRPAACAPAKLKKAQMDGTSYGKLLPMTVGNDVTAKGCGFGTTTNRVTFVFPDGHAEPLPMMSKDAVARRIVSFCKRHNAAAR